MHKLASSHVSLADAGSRLSVLGHVAKWYLGLWPAFPPARWTAPEPLSRPREEYQDEINGGFLKWFGNRISLSGKRLLDLGCGYGGRTVRYKELGAAEVFGLEINEVLCAEARLFAEARGRPVTFKAGCGENLEFPADWFDLIFAYDVLEHVADERQVLRECWRVLKPGGKLYAVFPPFYHPTGSHLDGYVSKMPYANLLFPSGTLMQAAQQILDARPDGYAPMPLRPKDKLWTLNGATISSFRRDLRTVPFASAKLTLAPLFSPLNEKWGRWRMKYYAPLFRPLRRLPLLRECLVHRITCELTK